MSAAPLLRMEGIDKSFPGVRALESVDFELEAGEVHVLLGENGAGKSTLMKILAGVYRPDGGSMTLGGERYSPRSTLEARRAGVVMVMQEFNLVPDLSVAENIVLLGRPEGSLLGPVRRREMEREAERTLARLGLAIPPGMPVRCLSVGEKQMVEIARAMSLSARVLVLDEPTAALADSEVGRLFELTRELTGAGVGVVYISHRFEEIFKIGGRVTTLRDGSLISTHRLSEVTSARLITDMAGRELSELYPRTRGPAGDPALEVTGAWGKDKVKDVSLVARAGQILGLAGLMGAGRTDLGKALFGAPPLDAGRIKVFGESVSISSPRRAMDLGLVYLTEDRKDEGLFMDKSVAWNISITDLASLLRAGLIDFSAERSRARGFIDSLRVRPPDETRLAASLSGGTQQKIALAKWLALDPRIMIMDEPTRGIDVGAKVEIYGLMDRFVAQGGAIILISSDLPELLAMSDRIAVMREGRLAGQLERDEFDQEKIMALATGA